MARSYFPSSDAQLLVWATNYKAKIGNYATELNLTQVQVDAEKAYCDDLIASLNNVSSKRGQLKASIGGRKTTVSTKGGALRAEIGQHKASPNFSQEIGLDLGIIAPNVTVDFANYKAQFTTEIYGGNIRIKFKKNNADGINLYGRKKGSLNWMYVARLTKNPYDYNFVLQTEGQPEHWEYRAFGVVDDAEIGVASDIVEILYAGS